MIRAVLGLFAFAVMLCAYIVIKPSDTPTPRLASAAATDVTRAATQSLLPGTPLPQPIVNEIVIAPQPAPAPQVQTDDVAISATAANVLAGLGLQLDVPVSETKNSSGAENAIPASAAPSTALENLVVAALKEGRPDSEIDSLVNAAARAGQLSVPEVLVTSDGRVDTAILLQSIINEATIAAGGEGPAVPDTPTGDGTGVEVRVVQRATETEQYRFYTVGPGDSLGAIAVKFYGNVNKYPLIYQANRSILPSPDQIQVGQRLSIPNLPQT